MDSRRACRGYDGRQKCSVVDVNEMESTVSIASVIRGPGTYTKHEMDVPNDVVVVQDERNLAVRMILL